MRNKLVTITSSMFMTIFCSLAFAGGIIGPELSQKLLTENGPHEVIVTFKTIDDVSLLTTLTPNFISLNTLPMAGVILTETQIENVQTWDTVESIYFNAPLQYSNYNSAEISEGHYVHDVLEVKGAGVTIAVLDSGVDGTHADLAYGSKVVQNVKLLGDLGVIGLNNYLEGVINTDTSSGHGTHVAGTVAGDGTVSANDERGANYHDGIAPEADLIGLGAGEGLNILYGLMGFDYAIANRDRFSIDIITNSWGGGDGSEFDPNNPINQASYQAYRSGIVVTFAASNSGPDEDTLNQYAIAPWVINVAAGTEVKELASFSSRGVAGHTFKQPDITAPGSNITSTRAPGTIVGATGPVIDPNHPEYYAAYLTISGTSMATPFVAGAAALMLEVNPNLSPDQIEEIIVQTADAMPGYQPHQVGAGHINVRAAVELAQATVGERITFLQGDTHWSPQGFWIENNENTSEAQYIGDWKSKTLPTASGGSYMESKPNRNAKMVLNFFGSDLKLGYPKNDDGGLAELFVDGVSQGVISYYSSTPQEQAFTSVRGLSDELHSVELVALQGKSYLDTFLLDGVLVEPGIVYTTQTLTHTGSMGISINGTSTHTIQFEITDETVLVEASLGWTGLIDLDFNLLDPAGNVVASSGTLANPEVLTYWVDQPGTYTYQMVGYIAVLTDYTLTSTLTRAETP